MHSPLERREITYVRSCLDNLDFESDVVENGQPLRTFLRTILDASVHSAAVNFFIGVLSGTPDCFNWRGVLLGGGK